jgi:hypothetical protein
MKRYRYRTATLIGGWRDTHTGAEMDAVAAGLMVFAPNGKTLVWRVGGEIEVEDTPRTSGASSR